MWTNSSDPIKNMRTARHCMIAYSLLSLYLLAAFSFAHLFIAIALTFFLLAYGCIYYESTFLTASSKYSGSRTEHITQNNHFFQAYLLALTAGLLVFSAWDHAFVLASFVVLPSLMIGLGLYSLRSCQLTRKIRTWKVKK